MHLYEFTDLLFCKIYTILTIIFSIGNFIYRKNDELVNIVISNVYACTAVKLPFEVRGSKVNRSANVTLSHPVSAATALKPREPEFPRNKFPVRSP